MAYQTPFPSIRYLKIKARRLCRAHGVGEPWARHFVEKHWRGGPSPVVLSLADAHRAMAHAMGSRDWPRLRHAIELLEHRRERGAPANTDSELDELTAMMGLRHPVSAWASRFVAAAGEPGHAAALRAMHHRDARVRGRASQFLDHFVTSWDGATLAALTSAIGDSSPRVRASVVHALGCQRCKDDPLDDDAIELLTNSLADPSAKVRRTAVASLWPFRHSDRARRGYLTALGDESARVRQHAAAGLGASATEALVEDALLTALATELSPRVRRALVTSLRIGAQKWRGLTRDAVEDRLGVGIEANGEHQPASSFFPLDRLQPGDTAMPPSGFWLRFIFDASDRVMSVAIHDSPAAP